MCFSRSCCKVDPKNVDRSRRAEPRPNNDISSGCATVPVLEFMQYIFSFARLAPTLSFASGAVLRIILKVAQDVQSSSGVLL